MANFPKREPDIVRLVHDIASGLTANKELFPSPPNPPDDLFKAIDGYYGKRDALVAKNAGSREGTAEKNVAINTMTDLAKRAIHYSESLFRKDASKLQLIGWGARRTRTVKPDELPGQAGNLAVLGEGKTWVSLSWRDPVDGGTVSAYRIQRRKTGGEWADVGTAVSSEATLNNQESAVELEYQVIAVNKAGDGPASNIVRVVL